MVDFNKKIYNTDKFRQSAIFFQEHGCYTLAPRGTTDYIKFWEQETNRCLNGYVAPDGDTITGYHYFYLNYSPIMKLDQVEYTDKFGKHMATLKCRQRGYSFKGASMLVRNYELIKGSKNFAVASEQKFLVGDGLLTKAW